MAALSFGRSANGFAIRNANGNQACLDVRLVFQTIQDGFDLRFSHGGNNRLVGFFATLDTNRGIVFRHARKEGP